MAQVITSKPNFLASEVGLVLKTISLDAVTNAAIATTENGAKVVKAGTVYSSGSIKGIIFEDIDVTNSTATTKVPASLMVAGRYIASKVTGTTTDFEKQGLFADATQGATVTRPY